ESVNGSNTVQTWNGASLVSAGPDGCTVTMMRTSFDSRSGTSQVSRPLIAFPISTGAADPILYSTRVLLLTSHLMSNDSSEVRCSPPFRVISVIACAAGGVVVATSSATRNVGQEAMLGQGIAAPRERYPKGLRV